MGRAGPPHRPGAAGTPTPTGGSSGSGGSGGSGGVGGSGGAGGETTSGGGGTTPQGGTAGAETGGTAPTAGAAGSAGNGVDPVRTDRGLQVLYTFEHGNGDTIADVSGVGTPLDLTIADTSVVTWQSGSLLIDGNTIASSSAPAEKIVTACKASNELSIEAWVEAESVDQIGPAVIATVSENADLRNLALGQNGAMWDVRVRMDDTNESGVPQTSVYPVTTDLTHIVYTLDADGRLTVYLDGEIRWLTSSAGGLQSWDETYAPALANENTGDPHWQGTLHLVAVYCSALTRTEVTGNFLAGP